MTSPEPMTRQELLELAALDGLGLLDSYEAALFTRSFHHAPVAVQDEILRLQAEIASDETLLPDVEPEESLRERVLLKVAEAIEKVDAELAPLATIGKNRRAADSNDRRSSFRSSGPFWRAAAFILTGSLAVTGYFLFNAQQGQAEIAKLALSNLTSEQLEQLIGPDITKFMFYDKDVERIFLHPINANSKLQAVLYVNTETKIAFLVTNNFARTLEQTYSVQISTPKTETTNVLKFMNNGALDGYMFDTLKYTAAMLATATWQITDAAGNVLLTSL